MIILTLFEFRLLKRSYLLKLMDSVKTPQFLWMRVAVAIHMETECYLETIKETYLAMSKTNYSCISNSI